MNVGRTESGEEREECRKVKSDNFSIIHLSIWPHPQGIRVSHMQECICPHHKCYPHFTDGELEAWRDYMTHPRSQRESVAKLKTDL